MKWTETITPKQAAEELGVPYHGWMREMDRAWISEDQKYSVMSRLLRTAWGKPFRSATPKLVVLLGQHRRIVCCVMCGYYAPLKKWNKEERKNESTH